MSKFYVAYGANLNTCKMAHRCPTAKVIGSAELKGYKLRFRGDKDGAYATVETCSGSVVPVLVWVIEPSDEIALDRYEGFPILYQKEMVQIKLGDDLLDAMIYIMAAGKELGTPSYNYCSIIVDGYKAAGFDLNVLKRAALESTT